jgi:glutamine amidotransferase
LAKAHASVPSVTELSATLRELLPRIAAHGTFNLLLSNGQALWAHCSTRLHWVERAHPFRAATLADDDVTVDLAALASPLDRVAVIATEPMTRNEAWSAMKPGELQVFVAGVALP